MPENYRPVYDLVRSKGPVRTVEIAEELGLKRSTATYIIRQLVELGLIRPTQKSHARNQAYVGGRPERGNAYSGR